MKFFSNLGSCYRPMPAPTSREREEGEVFHVAPRPAPAAAANSARHRTKRMKTSIGGDSASSSAARHWRPGLQAIREDGVGFDLDGKNSERRAHFHCENKSKPRYSSNPRRVSHHDDYNSRNNNNSAPMLIPAFSPTPFMF